MEEHVEKPRLGMVYHILVVQKPQLLMENKKVSIFLNIIILHNNFYTFLQIFIEEEWCIVDGKD